MADTVSKVQAAGEWEERIELEFADGSMLRVTSKVRAGERAFASSAGRWARRVRELLTHGEPPEAGGG